MTFFLDTDTLFPLFGLPGPPRRLSRYRADRVLRRVRRRTLLRRRTSRPQNASSSRRSAGVPQVHLRALPLRCQLQARERVDAPSRRRAARSHRRRSPSGGCAVIYAYDSRSQLKLIGNARRRPMSSPTGPGPSSEPHDRKDVRMTLDSRTRWYALIVLCLGTLMIVLDSTIVNVALPSIRSDLGFSETSLAWVVNAYLLTFGGFLLLGGRLGDLYGQRRLFLGGIALFTVASLACGLATSQEQLIAARAVQGARRRGRLGGLAVAHDEPLHGARRARQGDGHLRLRRLGRRLDRRAARRHPHRRARLALDLPRQHPDRRSRWCCSRCGCCPAAAARQHRREARRRRRRHGHRVADARRLRDRERQPGGLAVGAARSGCSPSPRRCSASFLLHRVARQLAADAARPDHEAQRRDREHRSACCGPPRCSRGSSSRRSTCSSCSATARSRSASRSSPGNIVMGVLSVGRLGQARDALRHQAAARDRAARGRRRAALARARTRRRHVRDRRPPEHDPARLRRRHRLQPGAAGGHERRQARGVGARVGHRQHGVHDGRRARPGGARSLAASRTETLTAEGEAHLEALTGGYHLAFFVGALFAISAAVIGGLLLRIAQPGRRARRRGGRGARARGRRLTWAGSSSPSS